MLECQCTIPYKVISARQVKDLDEKRESGESPERSGHCKQVVPFSYPLYCMYEKDEGMRDDL